MTDYLRESSRERFARSLGVLSDELQPGEIRTVRIDTRPAAQERRRPPCPMLGCTLPEHGHGRERDIDRGEWSPVTWSEYATATLVLVLILATMVVIGALVGP